MMDINKLKLVIWDMDDTFWTGTLSEGEIKTIPENIQVINTLVDHGVMNSICSKNNFDKTRKQLEKIGAWDSFVFPSIDWAPKAARLMRIIEQMALRPVNCLFIDDNEMNLNEAKFYLPEINLLHAKDLGWLYQNVQNIKKEDFQHKRLAQYRILEAKAADKSEMKSTDEFLQQSQIRLSVNEDCLEQTNRIAEMVERTNQLNFTKLRSSKADLVAILTNKEYRCATVSAKDRYGDYGIVGFFALHKKKNRLLHFLFSCRTMGMGIEQYVYESLNFPCLEIIGDVANLVVKKHVVTWINKESLDCEDSEIKIFNRGGVKQKEQINVLVKGPCDLDSIIPYLNVVGNVNLETEFNTVNKDGVAITAFNDTIHVVESQTLKSSEKEELLKSVPFLDESAFKTKLFEKKWDIVFLSLLPDGHEGVYRHKRMGRKICFTSALVDITDRENWEYMLDGYHPIYTHGFRFTPEILENFSQEYQFEGFAKPENIVKNLKFIRENLPLETLLVVMLPSEVEHRHTKDKIWANHAENHAKINRKIKAAFDGEESVRLINYTDFITSQECYADTINHFSRQVYYQLSQTIADIINAHDKTMGHSVEMKDKAILDKMEAERKKKAKKDRRKYLVKRIWRLIKTGK